MARTDWSQLVYDKQLATAKSAHKKQFITKKILSSELPEHIDAGWEKCKEYKSPKYVGVAKEKPITEQFEDRIWLLFASMGFSGMNAENGIAISYDFNQDDLKERISVMAVDEETVGRHIVQLHLISEMTDSYSRLVDRRAMARIVAALHSYRSARMREGTPLLYASTTMALSSGLSGLRRSGEACCMIYGISAPSMI